MELKFDLATEPAVKATIATVACTSIAYVTTHTQNWFGVIAALIISVISLVISTYKTPPFAPLNPPRLSNHVRYCVRQQYQDPNAASFLEMCPRETDT